MAGSIKTGPVTKEYERGFSRSFDTDKVEAKREVREHACEHCRRVMKYADQQCACTSRDPWKTR